MNNGYASKDPHIKQDQTGSQMPDTEGQAAQAPHTATVSDTSPAGLKAKADQILAEAGRTALSENDQEAPVENRDQPQTGNAIDYEALVATQKAEILALKDKLLRALAEAENVRRRTAREVEDARNFAITKFAHDMLTVQDNLDRALAALGDTALEEQTNLVKSMVEGVELTRNDLLSTLDRNGVKPIVSDGTRFDPKHHQALFELESDAEPGTVIQTMQVGYTIGERNLRPAMVGVAKAATPPTDAKAS